MHTDSANERCLTKVNMLVLECVDEARQRR